MTSVLTWDELAIRTKWYTLPMARKPMAPRRKAFLKALASGKHKSATQAAIAVGYPPETASQNASLALKDARENYPEALARLGFTPESIIKKYLKPALEATDRRDHVIDGKIVQGPEHPVWQTRMNALDKTFKMMGAYETAKDDAPTSITINVMNAADLNVSRLKDAIPVGAPKPSTQTPPFTSPTKEDPPISSHNPDPDDGTDCC